MNLPPPSKLTRSSSCIPEDPPALTRQDGVEDGLTNGFSLWDAKDDDSKLIYALKDKMSHQTGISGISQWEMFEKLPIPLERREAVLKEFYQQAIQDRQNSNGETKEEETKKSSSPV